MRRASLLLLLALAACSGPYDQQLDVINYAYAQHLPYAEGAWCTHKQMNDRDFIGCPYSVGGSQKTALWLIDGKTFLAVNGTARSDREAMGNYTDFQELPRPVPADIDIPATVAEFQR